MSRAGVDPVTVLDTANLLVRACRPGPSVAGGSSGKSCPVWHPIAGFEPHICGGADGSRLFRFVRRLPYSPTVLFLFTDSGGKEHHEERQDRAWHCDRGSVSVDDGLPASNANRPNKPRSRALFQQGSYSGRPRNTFLRSS